VELESEKYSEQVRIAKEIRKLRTLQECEVVLENYEAAAAALGRRKALEKQLEATGDEKLLKKLRLIILGSWARMPLVERIEPKEDQGSNEFAELLRRLPLPVRWVVRSRTIASIRTLKSRLSVDTFDSDYFGTRFPLFCQESLEQSTHPHEWVNVMINERRRSESPVIVMVSDLVYLSQRDIFDQLLACFADPYFEFIAWASDEDAHLAERIARLKGVTLAAVEE
jgi:hypothetical protein